MKVFVDTNVFMRFFTQDDVGQHAVSAGHFADAYIAASAEMMRVSSVATFNRRDFARLGVNVYRA